MKPLSWLKSWLDTPQDQIDYWFKKNIEQFELDRQADALMKSMQKEKASFAEAENLLELLYGDKS